MSLRPCTVVQSLPALPQDDPAGDSTEAEPAPATFQRLSSVQLANHLSKLTFDDGRVRWDASRGNEHRCLHCNSPDNVKRHLCVECRTARTPFMLPLSGAAVPGFESNPYLLAGGYRWCQRQCSGVPLPLTYFPLRGKKCCRCANARKRGLASGGRLVVRRQPLTASPRPAPRRKPRQPRTVGSSMLAGAGAGHSGLASPGGTRRSSRLQSRKQQRVDTSSSPSAGSPSSSSASRSNSPHATAATAASAPSPRLARLPAAAGAAHPPLSAPLHVDYFDTVTVAPVSASALTTAQPCVSSAPRVVAAPPAPLKPVTAPLARAWDPPTPVGGFPSMDLADFTPSTLAIPTTTPSKASASTVAVGGCTSVEETAELLLGDATPMGLAALDDLLATLQPGGQQ